MPCARVRGRRRPPLRARGPCRGRGGGVGRPRAAWYAGWTSGCSTISVREHVVDPIDHRRRRAEVGAQQCRLGADLLGGAEVLGDVGAPEPVDRLLRIADDEQPARVAAELSPVGVVGRVVGECREPHRDLELDRVGVLELVEQDPLVARVQQRARTSGRVASSRRASTRRSWNSSVPSDRASEGAVEHEPSDERRRAGTGGTASTSRISWSASEARSRSALRSASSASGPAVLLPLGLVAAASAPCGERRGDRIDRVEAGADRVAGREQPGEISRSRRAPRVWVSSVRCFVRAEQFGGAREDRLGVRRVNLGGGSSTTRSSTRSQLAWKSSATRRTPRLNAEPVELAQLHELAAAVDRAGRRIGIVEQPVEQVVPPLVEREVALELVEHGEAGREPGLDRELVQQPPGERVQRADRSVIEIVEGGGQDAAGVGAPRPQRRSGRGAGVAQVGGGLLGERDRGDRRDRHPGAHECERRARRAGSSCRRPHPPRRTGSRRDRS